MPVGKDTPVTTRQTRPGTWIFPIALGQMMLLASALALCVWINSSWLGLAAIATGGLGSIAGTIASQRNSARKYALFFSIAGSLVAIASAFLPFSTPPTADLYLSSICWLLAAVVFAPVLLARDSDRARPWKQIALVWGLVGSVVWVVASYNQNLALAFYVGLVLNIALLILTQFWFRTHLAVALFLNTAILILVLLPLVDLAMRLTNQLDTRPETGKRYYSYEIARRKPAAFATWWKYYNQQWEFMARSNFMRDPSGKFPFLLRPNSQGHLFLSSVSINSKGFRGKEISDDKGNAYRIVALGESTTFGCTLNAGDKPWPEVLEQLIGERFRRARSVEVINAGVPGYTLEHNLHRLQSDILPLKPDMLISYHGYNGLDLLNNSNVSKDPPLPPYRPRPLKLLADAEHGLKIRAYKRHLTANHRKLPPIADPMQSRYAAAYRELIQAARTNGITLVLGNFSMAANLQSEPGVLDFYRAGYPLAAARVRANAAHSQMVHELAKENPQIYFVDTHPNLDGNHEKFIDLVHFTQAGRQQLAETFFEGVTNILSEQLRKKTPLGVQ